ncbi:MAG: hypothetical protein P8Y37_13120 [Anaerolineales bacterium]
MSVDSNEGDELDSQIQADIVSTITRQAFLQEVEDTRGTEEAQQATEEYLALSLTPHPTQTPLSTATPNEVFPDMIPGAPYYLQTYVRDTLSVELADTKSTIGDDYAWSRFERPFSKELMLYSGDLDIYQVNLEVRDEWVYITFLLAERLPVEGRAQYAIELDVDHNGRGDYLITAEIPPDNNWTTDGVSVYADDNKDVGGLFPLYMEEIDSFQDGYESVLVSDGSGSDPDLAWVRRDPKHQTRLQLAFKYSLTGPYGFLWSAWAFGREIDPVERPGYGWCKANAYSNSCENNACLVNCPNDSFCIPCNLSP